MAKLVIGYFDSATSARAAIERLITAGVGTNRISTYPAITDPTPSEPSSNERVKGAETPMSKDGPLGHLGAIVAKLFHAEDHNQALSGGSEPTRELTGKSPVFLSLNVGDAESPEHFEAILKESGASRVAHHDE